MVLTLNLVINDILNLLLIVTCDVKSFKGMVKKGLNMKKIIIIWF